MNAIYRAISTTKQNVHQRLNRDLSRSMEASQILYLVQKVRSDHPRMSARIMYSYLHPDTIGRDAFIDLCFENGYKINRIRSFHKTTDSRGVTKFDNLIKDLKVTRVNQVYVSDITYYRIGDKFYYITFIMDLYSRRIIGYNASYSLLTTQTTIPALNMALKARHGADLTGTILHSDGGGQYYCKEFLEIINNNKMESSMAEDVYENANAERLNGIIKNDYLEPYGPTCLQSLKKMLTKAVNNYNNHRPHTALGGLSPIAFENSLEFSTKLELLTKRKKVAKKEKVNIY